MQSSDAVLLQAAALLGSLEEAFNGLPLLVELLPLIGVAGNPGESTRVVRGVFPELNQSQGEMRRWCGSNDGAGAFSKYG